VKSASARIAFVRIMNGIVVDCLRNGAIL